YYLPLMPWAIGTFDLRDYDLVLSSSHCVAKGVRVHGSTRHICYCFTPVRYVWDQFEVYFSRKDKKVQSLVMGAFRPLLKNWDVKSNQGVDQFLAISRNVQRKIMDFYGRESTVIPPPVDTRFFTPGRARRGDYFLIVSALSPYKRLDLAVEAFNKLGYSLKIIGVGPEETHLKKLAGPNVEFLRWLPDEEVRNHYERCRALIFPGEEDFGITPLEAQAMGRPVIALGKGGVLETVLPDAGFSRQQLPGSQYSSLKATGVFFQRPEVEALSEAIEYFISIENRFQPDEIRKHALQFDSEYFKYRFRVYIQEYLKRSHAEKI
ncbi:MAG: glycosyltransferase, partial [Nitrospinaceae bacterium]|nr:glycosyltransferase family 4 protein [Nitrospinaceae bacterium]NIR54610.1 glycosyltransferase family 4 protein [Nitrospinaceae bacterium]NIT81843.1 glycosyltransferase family 4 protein [Nitrospinaceae bacterium]NIW05702.1 glycosyltransferase [Nitrospinaceae bacterium]NIX34243.1 glycosyltransferase [Nitrospinaceae bacterium]